MKKYIFLLLCTAISFAQASNQMVSFTQAQSLGFALNSGKSHVSSIQCMTKLDAFTKYALAANANTNNLANNQLMRRDFWSTGFVGSAVEIIETTTVANASICDVAWIDPMTKYTKQGLMANNGTVGDANSTAGNYSIYNDVGCTVKYTITGKTFKVLEAGVYKKLIADTSLNEINMFTNCSTLFTFQMSSANSLDVGISCGLLLDTTIYSNVQTPIVGTKLYTDSAMTVQISDTARFRTLNGTKTMAYTNGITNIQVCP